MPAISQRPSLETRPSLDKARSSTQRVRVVVWMLLVTFLACFYFTNPGVPLGIIGSKNKTQTQTGREDHNNSSATVVGDDGGDDFFEHVLWPSVQKKLCPNGLPQTTAWGAKLFELARMEFGRNRIPDNTTTNSSTTTKPPVRPRPISPRLRRTFFDGFYDANGPIPLVLVDDENGTSTSLMYGRIYKGANDQIRNYLGNNLNHNNNTRKKYTYLEPSRYNVQKYKEPCVFTVIRDPISHFLSGYNEIETRPVLKYAWVGPMQGEVAYRKISYQDAGELRFESFVQELVEENVFFAQWIFLHMYPMSRILNPLNKANLLPTTASGGKSSPAETNIWILPSIVNLTETLPAFLAERCPSFAANYDPSGTLPAMKASEANAHPSQKDPLGTYQAAKNVWKKGGRVARSLCHLHAFDYACFYGDSSVNPTGTTLTAKDIPSTCKSVYKSDLFYTNASLSD